MRMMLEYAGAEYEDTVYTDPQKWFKEKKPELLKKNALANLPYLEMPDGVVVSESNACYTYLQFTLGLTPEDPAAKIKCQELLSLCMCTRNDMTNRCYPFNGMCADRASFDASMTKLLGSKPFAKYEATLAASATPFFCGDAPSACDFHIWEMLDQYTKVATELRAPLPLDEHPLCKAFYQRVKELPSLQAYFKSDAYALGCNANIALWK